MNLEGYAATMTGVVFGLIAGGVGIISGDVVGGLFSAVCFFVFGVYAFLKVTDVYKNYKAICRWERHREKQIDFKIGRPVQGMPGYVEVEL